MVREESFSYPLDLLLVLYGEAQHRGLSKEFLEETHKIECDYELVSGSWVLPTDPMDLAFTTSLEDLPKLLPILKSGTVAHRLAVERLSKGWE